MTAPSKLLMPLAISIALSVAACQQPTATPTAPPAASDTLPDTASANANVNADAIGSDGSNTSIADRAAVRQQASAANSADAGPAYARVISVVPVRDDNDASHRECHDVAVTRKAPVKDKNKIAGTAIGAVVGGVLGNQVGGGRGRDLATVAGAVGGGVAGRKIQENQQDKRTVTSMEQRCRTVKDSTGSGAITGYDIVYEYAGESHKARVADDPGDRIALPVRSIE